MSLRSVVLPALGGETMSARWPRPMGQNMSIRRQEAGHPGYSRVSRGWGSIEVSSSKGLAPWGSVMGLPSMSRMALTYGPGPGPC